MPTGVYKRTKKHIGINAGAFIPIEVRFWSKVKMGKLNECWEWQGAVASNGYGNLKKSFSNNSINSHRISWELHKGKIPKELHVLHKCDNKLCVNPNHLYLGTNKDNMRDKAERNFNIKGEKNHSAKYTNKDILKIRGLYKNGVKQIDIAKIFNTKQGAISDIVNRKVWKHI